MKPCPLYIQEQLKITKFYVYNIHVNYFYGLQGHPYDCFTKVLVYMYIIHCICLCDIHIVYLVKKLRHYMGQSINGHDDCFSKVLVYVYIIHCICLCDIHIVYLVKKLRHYRGQSINGHGTCKRTCASYNRPAGWIQFRENAVVAKIHYKIDTRTVNKRDKWKTMYIIKST